jgi:anaerobic magnesium-protoporphyrin IX monomethyl ester cyclase
VRIAFIQKDPLPDPSLMRLAAATVFRGHQVSVFIPAAEKKLHRALRRFAPDALLFAPATGFQDWTIAQARQLKRVTGGAPNLFTGTHVNDYPEIAHQDGVDLLLTGDPETTLSEILEKLERGHGKARDLPGTGGTVAAGPDGTLIHGATRQSVDDLDELPLADIEIYRRYPFIRKQTTLSFASGRGTPENTHAGFRIGLKELQRRFTPCRRHSADEAIRRLHLHIHRRPIYRRVAFREDSLLMDDGTPWLQSFLAQYREEIGLPFSCLARPDQLDDPTIRLLAESGCERVRLGVETGDPGLRKKLCGVDLSNEDILQVNANLRRAGIDVQTITFLGVPGETTESALRSLDLNLKLAPSHAFAIGVAGPQGGPVPAPWANLQLLMPLVVRFPFLRSQVERRMADANSHFLESLFQVHHDASFMTSGELHPIDILKIAHRMKRSRNRVTSNLS